MTEALVIGGGPAGLMAADVLSAAGHSVCLAEAMPTLGRKFLMAGKSGLNLTKMEDPARFQFAFSAPQIAPILSDFGPEAVCDWAEALGQEVFTGSTGRVFPRVMKASPVLRAWIARLTEQGVDLRTRWRWTGWSKRATQFDTPDGTQNLVPKVTILALGGASWARLGSDGGWAGHLPDAVTPFQPANMGFEVSWSPHMRPHFGAAVKGCRLVAGDVISRGEFVLSERGIEGGGVYMVSAALRDGARLILDLLPDWSAEAVAERLANAPAKASRATVLRKAFKLDAAKRALLNEWARDLPLAQALKALPAPVLTPRPMDEAISTAGGVRFDALTPDLELKSRPGVFCAGEMLDWEAPTGGYLITGCLATGRWAGLAAAARLQAG